MDGTTGRLFREFSIVVSGSVIISSFAALTFTPMLATKLLIKREKQSWFYRKTEPFFEGMNNVYSRSLAAFLRKRWIALPFTALTIIIIGFLWNYIPAEMSPLEDRSQISINTRGAEGVTYEYIRDYTEDINQLVDSIVPDAEAVTARVSSGSGNVRITLKDMQDRDYTQMEVAEKLSKAVQKKRWPVLSCSSLPRSVDDAAACPYSTYCKLPTLRNCKRYFPSSWRKYTRIRCSKWRMWT